VRFRTRDEWTGDVEFSLAIALTILLAIVVVRRLEIDIWGLAAIAAIVLVISASIVWNSILLQPPSA
jgi:hypothetical protein